MAETYKWIYTAESGHAWITGLEGQAPESLTVPDTLDGCEVTALGLFPEHYEQPDYDPRTGEVFTRPAVADKTCALTGMEGVKSLRLPHTLRQMSKEVFDQMDELGDVTVCSSFFTVDGGCLFDFTGALYGVFTDAKEVTLPEKVKKILPRAFRFSPSVEKVILRHSVYSEDSRYAGAGALTGSRVREVVFPDGITSLGAFFKDYSGIERLTIPASVKNLMGLFDGCTSLKEVTLNEGLTVIGSRSFAGCASLESVNLPSSLKEIEDEAFSRSGLRSIAVPDGVTKIGKNVFQYCSGLEEAVLPRDATLGWEAFRYCESLRKVTLPETLTQIPSYTFEKCTSLEEIVIPDGVHSICEKAFAECKALRSVRLPKTLASIYDNAFYGCEKMESIVLPKSVEWLYECALFHVQRVFYEGSAEDFKKIHKSFCNGRATYFYAETAPAAAGKYWHYVDGEPVIWD